MATLTKTFDFNASPAGVMGSYTSEGGEWTTSLTSADATKTDIGITDESGSGIARRVGLAAGAGGRNNTTRIKWRGTWEQLGLPVGAVINEVTLGFRYKRSEVQFVAAPEEVGPFEYRAADGVTVRGTSVALINTGFSATWATRAGSAVLVPEPDQASDAVVEFDLWSKQGAQNTGKCLHDFDTVTVDVLYDAPPADGNLALLAVG